MIRRLCLLLIVSGGWLSAGAAVASDNPLEAIPDGAGALLRFRAPQQTTQKAAALAGKLNPQFAQHVQGAAGGLGALVSNPRMTGVDTSSDWWVAVYPQADRDPGVVFIVPASDADAMESAVKAAGQYQFARQGKWVLYTEDTAAAKSISERIAGQGEAITQVLDEASLAVMNGSDLSLFVNVPRLRTVYKAQLDQARQGFNQFLDQLSNLPVQQQGFDIQPVLKLYAGMFRGLMQGLDDTEGFTVGLTVHEGGVAVDELVNFASESGTAEFFGSLEASDLTRLGSLPADQPIYVGGHFDMQALLSWSMEFSVAMFQNDPARQEKLRQLIGEYGKLEYGDFAGSFGLGDAEGGLFRGVFLWEVEPAEKMRELAQAFGEQMQIPSIPGVTTEIKYQADAEEYGERSADVMTMKQTVDPNVDPSGVQQKMSALMFGPEGMVSRSVFLDGEVVQTQGGGRELMTEALKALDEGGELAGPAAATRAQLGEEANLCVLFDVPSLVAQGFVAVAKSGAIPVPLDPEPVEQLELERSYAGFAISAEEGSLRCRAFVPVEQAQGMMSLVQAFHSMRQQGQ